MQTRQHRGRFRGSPAANTGQGILAGVRAWVLEPGCLHLNAGFVTSDKPLGPAVPQLTHL